MVERQRERKKEQHASVHGCCSEPWGKPYADIARCQKIQPRRQMKVCFTRSSTDPKALAEVMSRQKLTGGTLHNDTAVILIILLCKNKESLPYSGQRVVAFVC